MLRLDHQEEPSLYLNKQLELSQCELSSHHLNWFLSHQSLWDHLLVKFQDHEIVHMILWPFYKILCHNHFQKEYYLESFNSISMGPMRHRQWISWLLLDYNLGIIDWTLHSFLLTKFIHHLLFFTGSVSQTIH